MFDWTKAFAIGGKIINAIRALIAKQPVNENFEVSISGQKFVVSISVAPVQATQLIGAPSLMLSVRHA